MCFSLHARVPQNSPRLLSLFSRYRIYTFIIWIVLFSIDTDIFSGQIWQMVVFRQKFKRNKGARHKKNTGLFGSFSQVSDPPSPAPLFGRPPSKKSKKSKNPKNPKKIKTCFSTSEWFWHAKKLLGQITKVLGFWEIPPPLYRKNSQIIP